MVGVADKLAVGDVNVNVDANTKDEIGKLAQSFKHLIESTREQAMVAERLAEGDLTVDVKVRSDKDLLGIKLAELVQKLNEMMTNISAASEQVATGAKQVSDSSIALSQGATEQASSIEELTASLEEISSQCGRGGGQSRSARQGLCCSGRGSQNPCSPLSQRGQGDH